MNLSFLPQVNASLNALSFICLVTGLILIKTRRTAAHGVAMKCAGIVSALFLACYLTFHAKYGSIHFTAEGTPRTVYFAILISHTLLALVVAIMAPITFWHAHKHNWEKHKRFAKITMPIWLYVSMTGVIVYMMLYQWYPSTEIPGT